MLLPVLGAGLLSCQLPNNTACRFTHPTAGPNYAASPTPAASNRSVSVESLFPCGEGAGYAGGIVSAAVDGMRVGEAVVESLTGVHLGLGF